MFDDLRQFIARVNELGELKQVDGADWDLEIGAITEIEAESPDARLLLFQNIKGYPPDFRVASNLFNTSRRIALPFGLPLHLSGTALVRAMKERIDKGITLIPPVYGTSGPVAENVFTGDDVDIMKFPSPRWHKDDGGRYIGTNGIGSVNAERLRAYLLVSAPTCRACNEVNIQVQPGSGAIGPVAG